VRILFAGTPEIAVPSLRAAAASHTVVGVLTNPDRAAGRGRDLHVSPVKAAARELGLPVLQPHKLDAAFRGFVRELEPELLVAFAYGRIFGPLFLECFPRGGINVHPSLLPRYRGPSPINAAILNGDARTGISIQSLALEMDAGDIILQESFPLTGKETAGSLTQAAAEKGAVLLARALDLIAEGKDRRVPQDGGQASYCKLLDRQEAKIDWKNSAVHIGRMIRAFNPWPGAWTVFKGQSLRILAAGEMAEERADFNRCDAGANDAFPANTSPPAGPESVRGFVETDSARPGDCCGETQTASRARLRPLAADADDRENEPLPGKVLGVDTRRGILIQTGNGLLGVLELQLQSKKAMDFASFMNGVRGFAGSILGDAER
jgi:methionyl-tRNA formyltransferase